MTDSYLLETDGSDVTQVVYTSEPEQYGRLISQYHDTHTQHVHADALGSTRELSDSTETVSDTLLYDAWGNVLNRTGTSNIPFQYVGDAGYYHDEELGSNYIRARHYEPTIGRWLSVDPLGEYDGPNVFSYVVNRLLSFIDPSGNKKYTCSCI